MFTFSMIQMFSQDILLTISNLRIGFFGATNIMKNTDKRKYVFSEYWITFDSSGSLRFNDTARNVITFCVYNSSSSNSDNSKKNILELVEGSTFREQV